MQRSSLTATKWTSVFTLMERRSYNKTQGDPLAMAMYAVSTIPLINRLSNENAKQAWYADDASAAGNIHALRHWWDHLVELGPDYGYHPNAPKTWLIVKEEILPLT